LGFLRLFLALSVMFGHYLFASTLPIVDPGTAVYCFFVLSGFYISLALNGKYAGRSMVLPFYFNRVLRLWPAYLVSLVVMWPTGALSALFGSADLLSSYFGKLAVILSNFTMIGLDMFYHLGARDGRFVWSEVGMDPGYNGGGWIINPPAWSLSVEILFYAVAPFIVVSFWRSLAFLAVGIGYYAWLKLGSPAPGVFRYDLVYPYQMVYFGLGMMTFQLYNLRHAWNIQVYIAAGLIAIVLMLLPLHINSLIYLTMAVLLLGLFDVTKSNPVDRFLGDLSYPVYILHYPVGMFLLWSVF
jgi:peptidoglycan/LPS O-acetylase OafA/YrhL